MSMVRETEKTNRTLLIVGGLVAVVVILVGAWLLTRAPSTQDATAVNAASQAAAAQSAADQSAVQAANNQATAAQQAAAAAASNNAQLAATAQHYAIVSPDEARAYLDHPLLGPRLLTCAEAATGAEAPSLHALFGSPDDLKFVSSMTLFRLAAPDPAPFQKALDRWNGGRLDERTVELTAR